jgi:hypothetical protein
LFGDPSAHNFKISQTARNAKTAKKEQHKKLCRSTPTHRFRRTTKLSDGQEPPLTFVLTSDANGSCPFAVALLFGDPSAHNFKTSGQLSLELAATASLAAALHTPTLCALCDLCGEKSLKPQGTQRPQRKNNTKNSAAQLQRTASAERPS